MRTTTRILKYLAALGVAMSVFGAISVCTASASSFEYSSTGSLSGKALNTQVFTTNGGEMKCAVAKSTGTVTELEAEAQKVKVEYAGCTWFGFASVTISPAEYKLHAGGTVDVLNTITISLPLAGCTMKVGPQTGLKSVSYENNSGTIIEKSAVEKVTYTSTGGLCGSSGSNGKYSGNNEVELVGGTMKFIP